MTNLSNNAYLKQTVEVRCNFKMGRGHSNPCIAQIVKDIEQKVTSNSAKTIGNIGKAVSDMARIEQHQGLHHYKAIFSGKLFNSITSSKKVASKNYVKYEVGTTINEPYPYYLIKGRRAVRPVNRKALRFKLTPNGEYLFRTFVKASKPKDYMQYADKNVKPMIGGLVGHYIHELFR